MDSKSIHSIPKEEREVIWYSRVFPLVEEERSLREWYDTCYWIHVDHELFTMNCPEDFL